MPDQPILINRTVMCPDGSSINVEYSADVSVTGLPGQLAPGGTNSITFTLTGNYANNGGGSGCMVEFVTVALRADGAPISNLSAVSYGMQTTSFNFTVPEEYSNPSVNFDLELQMVLPDGMVESSIFPLITIPVIDTVAPGAPVISLSSEVQTIGPITVTIDYATNADATTRVYQIDALGWVPYAGPFSVNEPCIITAKHSDEVGNESEIASKTIDNIGPVVSASATSATNEDVVVSISYPAAATTLEYRLDSGSWLPYTDPLTLTDNHLVEAQCILPSLTVVTHSLNVDYIDKIDPEAPIISRTPCIEGIVTVTVDYPVDAAQTLYKVDEGTWQTYTVPLQITKNCTIFVACFDDAGNESPGALLDIADVVPALQSIVVDPASFSVTAGMTQTVVVTGIMSNGTTIDITSSAAYVPDDTTKVLVVADGTIKGLAETQGATNITVSQGTKSTIIQITVLPPVITGISTGANQWNLPKGQGLQLEVLAELSDGSTTDITDFCSYTSSNVSAVTIDQHGTLKTVEIGAADIEILYNSTFATSLLIIVDPPVVEGINVTLDAMTMPSGRERQINVQAQLSDDSIIEITGLCTYTTDDPNVCTISPTGILKWVNPGSTIIHVAYDTFIKDLNIDTIAEVPDEIIITPDIKELHIGKSIELTATLKYSNNKTISVTDIAEWRVSNARMARVVPGKITGLSTGQIVLSIKSEGIIKEIPIRIIKIGAFKLMIDRCTDQDIKGYYVMRRSKENLDPQKIMEVSQPDVSPILITNDRLTWIDGKWYSKHGNILNDRPITVSKNGGTPGSYEIAAEEGIFTIPGTIQSDEILASYTFDGVRVMDIDTLQSGVSYYGPPPLDDTPLLPPANTIIEANSATNQVVIRFEEQENAGTDYYYHWIAFDERGNQSMASDEVIGRVLQTHPDTPYKLEKQLEDGTWVMVKYSTERVFTDGPIDVNAPDKPTGLTANVVMQEGAGVGNVTLTWDQIPEDKFTQSAKYRIKCINAVNEESVPGAVVGPATIRTGLNKIIVRRKLYQNDNMFPSFDGTDAVTIAELAPAITSFEDLGLTDQAIYAYSVFAIDNGGNVSVPAIVLAELDDVTPPEAPTIVSAESRQL